MADVEQIHSLGLRVERTEVDQAKESLDTFATSAEKAEKSTNTLRDASGGLSKAQQEIVRMMQQTADAVKAANFADAARAAELQQEIDKVRALASATSNLSLVERELVATENALAAGAERAAVAQQAAARAANDSAAANSAAGSGIQIHGLQLGRLNQELGTFLGRITGTNTAVTRLGAQVGGAIAGYATTIGILAGLALIGEAYEKITAHAREAQKAAEEFAKSEEARAATATGLGIVASDRGGITGLDIPAVSDAAQKASDAVRGLETNLTHLRDAAGAGGALAGQQSSAVRDLAQSLLLGQVNANSLAVALGNLPKQTPRDVADNVALLGEQLLAARVHLEALTDTVKQATAQQNYYTLGLNESSVVEGKLSEQIDQRRKVLAAFQQGGPVAGRQAEADVSAFDAAQHAYQQLATDGKHAELATTAFQDALARTASVAHPAAQALYDQAKQYTDLGLAISAVQKQQSATTSDTSRLSTITDQIERFGAEVGAVGKDASIDARVNSMDDALGQLERTLQTQLDTGKKTQVEFDQIGAAIEAARQSLYDYGQQARDAASDALTKQINDQHIATKQLYDAVVDGTGAYHELTAAKAAHLEISQRELLNGHALTDAQKEQIESTHQLAAAIEDAKWAQSIKERATALQAEIDAIKSGASTRATYAADLTYQTELAKAATIAAGPVHDAAVKDIEDAHNKAVALALLKDATNDVAAATKNANKEFAAVQSSIERDLLRSVEQFTSQGITSFQSFFREIDQLALRSFGQLDASIKKLSTDWATAFAAGDDDSAKQIDAQLSHLESLRSVAADVGAAISGGIAGFNVGRQTNNTGYGELAGGVTGAATGFATAGLPGAIAGAFGGVIGGLLGAAEAHKQAAKAIEAAGKSLATNISAFAASNSTQAALAANDAKQQQLDQQAEDLLRARSANARGGPDEVTGYIKQYANDLAQIQATAAANRVQIALDFTSDIAHQLNALGGTTGAYANQLLDLKKAYDQNVASATALGVPLDDITKLYTEQVAAATAAYDEGQKQLQFSLDAREAYAKGLTAEGDALTRRAQEDKEIFDATQQGYTDAQLDQLRYIQGLEDAAAAQKKEADAAKALADATNMFATNLAAGPNGTLQSQQSAALQPLLDKQTADLASYAAAVAQYSSDIANGADPIKTTTDYFAALTAGITLAGDQAAIAAKQWQDAQAAIAQANTDIANAVQGGHISGASGLAAEAQNFGFTGLSDAQINALYTDPTKGDLTNEQRQTNQNIDQYLADEKRWGQQLADAITSTSAANPKPSDAVSYAARNLSEVTGNRMADYLSSILTVEREQLDFWKGGGAGQVSRIVADQQRFYNALSATPLPNFTNAANAAPLAFPTAPSAPASAQTAPRAVAPPSGPTTVTLNINVRVNADGKIDRSELPQLGEDIAEFVEEALARRAQQQRLADGSPLLAGR